MIVNFVQLFLCFTWPDIDLVQHSKREILSFRGMI